MSEARRPNFSVTVVPPTLHRYTSVPINSIAKRRVAAYARVSTNKEEQATSYEAQVSYYTNYINSNSNWKFVYVYTDKGITGTNTKKRDGFNQMIADALAGKIDLIITKSVSRFARNTVDSLTTIRKLKERGIEVYFEEQNIYTLDSKGELLLTIMSSLAQEESRSISENVTWGQRKRFADGKVSMPYKHFLGYQRGEDGTPMIVEEEAVIVRRIYRMFLDGKTPIGIANILTNEEIPTPAGKSQWQTSTILSILTNEKYKGDALLQKTFCTDFLTKKMKINEGEVPQYYVTDSHPAIVSGEMFDLVQMEMEERKLKRGQHNGTHLFSGKILCGCCGGAYGRKVWHSNTPYRRIIWRCNAKFRNQQKCTTPHITEEAITAAFVQMVNTLVSDSTNLIADCRMLLKTFGDTSQIQTDMQACEEEMNITQDMLRMAIEKNARTAMDQDVYTEIYSNLAARYEKADQQYEALNKELLKRKAFRDRMRSFIATIDTEAPITEFTSEAWNALVQSATIQTDGSITFLLKNDMSITV